MSSFSGGPSQYINLNSVALQDPRDIHLEDVRWLDENPLPRGTKRAHPDSSPLEPPFKLPPYETKLKKWTIVNPIRNPLPRPDISYSTLCILTVLNSPEQIVTCSQVYAFVMHHFAYYRFAPISWQSNVRSVMCGTKKSPSKEFELVGRQSSKKRAAGLYALKDEQEARCKARLELMSYNLRTNRCRGDLLDRMVEGKLGLPRQLFYQVIGLLNRGLAGPENSAMFYHLLAGKIIPTEEESSKFFKEYVTEHTGNEPTHWKRWKEYDLKKCEAYSGWGEGLGEDEEEEALTMDQRECAVFHEHVEEYFGLQKRLKSEGFDDWATPLHSVVFESVLFPHL